jgi:hypothetical protein
MVSGPPHFVGFVAPFDVLCNVPGWLHLVFKPGAFRHAIAANVIELWPSHADPPDTVLASTANATLRLFERAAGVDAGLYLEAWMPDAIGRAELTERIRTRDVVGLSIDIVSPVAAVDSGEITHHQFVEQDAGAIVREGIARVYHHAKGLRAIALCAAADGGAGFRRTWIERVNP